MTIQKFCNLVFLSIFTTFSSYAQTTRAEKLVKELHSSSSKYVFVVAHRGDWRNAPENSLQAIERSINMGVDIVELDIRMTKDSMLVLMHDSSIDRTTNGKGEVSDYTYDELMQFRLKDGLGITLHEQQIPTLEQALLLCKDKILINVDKAEFYMDKVQRLLKETGCKAQVIYKGNRHYSDIKNQYGDLLDHIIYMPIVNDNAKNLDSFVDEFIRYHKPVAFEVLFATEDSPMFEQMNKMQKNGCRIWVNSLWSYMNAGHDDERAVYDPDKTWGWLIEKGTSIIQTDRPKELIQYLESKGLHRL